MTRKQDKKRRSISTAQNQRRKDKLEGVTPAIAEKLLPASSDTETSEPADTISVPVMLTIEQLGQWLNLSRSTIHRLDKSGKLPGRVLIGRQVRYHRPDIELWIQEQIRG